MHRRWWIYLAASIIGAILIVSGASLRSYIFNNATKTQAQSSSQEQKELSSYLAKQSNPNKLINLAKLLKNSGNNILEPIVDRAYALAPTNPNILVLDSQFHPALKSKITTIDPLYQKN